jgi:hypothetical protein
MARTVKRSRLIRLSVLFHPWQRPGMDKRERCGDAAASYLDGPRPRSYGVVGPWLRNREL